MSFWDPTTWQASDFDPTRWDEQLDPTTKEGQRNLLNFAPPFALANWSLGDPMGSRARNERDAYNARLARDRARAAAQGEADYYANLGRRYGEIGSDDPGVQRDATALYRQDDNQIGLDETRASSAIAAGSARAGGRGGYGQAAIADVFSQAASQRAKARQSAFDTAIARARQAVAGEANIHGQGSQFTMALLTDAQRAEEAARARAAADDALWQKIVGGALGYMAGGPAGASLGAQLGQGSRADLGGGDVQVSALQDPVERLRALLGERSMLPQY